MRLLLAAALAAFLIAAPGSAQDEDDENPQPFDGGHLLYPAGLFFASLDTDGDFAITAAERQTGYQTAFSHADRNGSGDISPLEYADFAERALGARDALPGLVTLDTDLDGRVSAQEFARGFEAMAARYARAEDGVIVFSALIEDAEELGAEMAVRIRLERQRRAARDLANERRYPD